MSDNVDGRGDSHVDTQGHIKKEGEGGVVHVATALDESGINIVGLNMMQPPSDAVVAQSSGQYVQHAQHEHVAAPAIDTWANDTHLPQRQYSNRNMQTPMQRQTFSRKYDPNFEQMSMPHAMDQDGGFDDRRNPNAWHDDMLDMPLPPAPKQTFKDSRPSKKPVEEFEDDGDHFDMFDMGNLANPNKQRPDFDQVDFGSHVRERVGGFKRAASVASMSDVSSVPSKRPRPAREDAKPSAGFRTIKEEKLHILLALRRMKADGVKGITDFDIDSDIDEMRMELKAFE